MKRGLGPRRVVCEDLWVRLVHGREPMSPRRPSVRNGRAETVSLDLRGQWGVDRRGSAWDPTLIRNSPAHPRVFGLIKIPFLFT